MVSPTNMSNIESVLSQIRQYQSQAAEGINTATSNTEQTQGVSAFADSIKVALQ